MTGFFWTVTISLFFVSIISRAIPFLIADLMGEPMQKLGKFLPAYIMLLLVIYEIKIETLLKYPYGLPAFSALALVLVSQLWLRNTVISILIGTLSYMLFSHWI